MSVWSDARDDVAYGSVGSREILSAIESRIDDTKISLDNLACFV